ncbi:hypothetical protein F4677DRAFT_456929 [Hypoxylon crocopeplum]|nr:hypothetical protein F4677DRAFT_456929 [Hypoxylon crocopeplum]
MSTNSRIINDLGLNWTAARRDNYLNKVTTIYLPRLDLHKSNQYHPPPNKYIAGTPKAGASWHAYWKATSIKRHEKHYGQRHDIVSFHNSYWRRIIQKDESIIIRDEVTRQIVLILVSNITDTCIDISRRRTFEREDDPGHLAHFGYTCGSWAHPQLQLAEPFPKLYSQAEKVAGKRLNNRSLGMAGLVWNMLRSRLPEEIISDFNDTTTRYGLPRMDMMKGYDTSIAFTVKGEDVILSTGPASGLELPPLSGLVAFNYGRYTHNEVNCNNWVIGYTTHAPEDPKNGGNFYLAQYGVLVLAASNTVFTWHPTDYHGTTLFEMKPALGDEICAGVRVDGDFNIGFIFEMSKRLRTAPKKLALGMPIQLA